MNRLFRGSMLCLRQFAGLFACVALSAIAGDTLQSERRLKPYRVEDMYFHESAGSPTFSSDGQAVAFIRRRPLKSRSESAQIWFRSDDSRADVWLSDGSGKPAMNLTKGEKDNSGWWAPSWSPDGQRLAFLSSRGGFITLWMWERATARLRQISPQNVMTTDEAGYRWLDSHRIICLGPAEGQVSRPESHNARIAGLPTEAWARAARGEVTASPVNSLEFVYPTRRIVVIDVDTGKIMVLGETSETPAVPAGQGSATWWLAPDGRTVAFAREGPLPYNSVMRARIGDPRSIELRGTDGQPVVLDGPLPENVHTQSLRWSPDGRSLAFFANGVGPVNPLLMFGIAAADVMSERVDSLENPAKLYRIDLERRRVEQIETGDFDLGALGSPKFMWTAFGELVFNVPVRQYGITAGPPGWRGAPWGWTTANAIPMSPPTPRQWMVLDRSGRSRPITKNGPPIPTSLRPIQRGRTFLGVRDGELWQVDPQQGTIRNLTSEFEPGVVSLFMNEDNSEHETKVVLSVDPGRTPEEAASSRLRLPSQTIVNYLLDLASGRSRQLVSPNGASLLALSAPTDDAVYTTDDDGATVMWRVSPAGEMERLAEINTHRRGLIKSDCTLIEYTSLNGESLKADFCLPIDYQQGRRYPMVVAVRMGFAVRESVNIGLAQIYTGAGYAYLTPSLPRDLPGQDREEGDSLLMVTNGVLPAVDKAVETRTVDVARVFVIGSSRGGWTALGLAAMTTRFKAVVSDTYGSGATAGTPSFGDFSRRYTDNPADAIIADGWNKGYRPSNVPWWRDGDFYRRNSPMTYVDRVQTPILLLHGDLDADRFSATEQYFLALVSMRKPAQFVRYWGEAHGYASVANYRDKYMRTFAWFDQWGDITRDADGNMIFHGDRVKSRKGAPPLKPEAFSKFGPTATASHGKSSPSQ